MPYYGGKLTSTPVCHAPSEPLGSTPLHSSTLNTPSLKLEERSVSPAPGPSNSRPPPPRSQSPLPLPPPPLPVHFFTYKPGVQYLPRDLWIAPPLSQIFPFVTCPPPPLVEGQYKIHCPLSLTPAPLTLAPTPAPARLFLLPHARSRPPLPAPARLHPLLLLPPAPSHPCPFPLPHASHFAFKIPNLFGILNYRPPAPCLYEVGNQPRKQLPFSAVIIVIIMIIVALQPPCVSPLSSQRRRWRQQVVPDAAYPPVDPRLRPSHPDALQERPRRAAEWRGAAYPRESTLFPPPSVLF